MQYNSENKIRKICLYMLVLLHSTNFFLGQRSLGKGHPMTKSSMKFFCTFNLDSRDTEFKRLQHELKCKNSLDSMQVVMVRHSTKTQTNTQTPTQYLKRDRQTDSKTDTT